MERRYTALAEQQGTLAAEKEKLSSEKQTLIEVIAAYAQACAPQKAPSRPYRALLVGCCHIQEVTRAFAVQDLRVCKTQSTKVQADLFKKDSLLQRKDVEVRTAPPCLQ